MSEGYYCPVVGCDYGEEEEKTRQSVRSHITGSKSDAHDWDQLRDELYTQNPHDDDDDGAEADDGDEGDEGNDSGDGTETKDGDGKEGDSMAARADYDAQTGDGTDDGTDDGDDDDDITVTPTDAADGGDSLIPVPKLDGMTVMLLVIVAGVVLFIALRRRGDDDGGERIEIDDTGDGGDDEEGGAAQSSEPVSDPEVSLIG